MNYNFAKQLKDAGFPQDQFFRWKSWINTETGDECKWPTLEEAIEECGDGFISLTKVLSGFVAKGEITDDSLIGIDDTAFGTPVEAVLKLWLELNKKKK